MDRGWERPLRIERFPCRPMEINYITFVVHLFVFFVFVKASDEKKHGLSDEVNSMELCINIIRVGTLVSNGPLL